MSGELSKTKPEAEREIADLQKELAVLEIELQGLETKLEAFNRQIHSRLDREMARIQELTEVYKNHKKEKKARRLEQKKKGKNWVEPKSLPVIPKNANAASALPQAEQQELKRLYKEAVVQFHPDKIEHAGEAERIKRATAITAQLNSIYKRGDLDELISFYQQITREFDYPGAQSPVLTNSDAGLQLEALKRKRVAAVQRLEQLKNSYTYHVLTTYENPLSFIDELYLYFLEKIKQLEKRTRNNRNSA